MYHFWIFNTILFILFPDPDSDPDPRKFPDSDPDPRSEILKFPIPIPDPDSRIGDPIIDRRSKYRRSVPNSAQNI